MVNNMTYGIIYKVTNITNEKCYIGQTIYSLQQRKCAHKNNVKYNRNPTSAFYNAIRKYGWDNFKWEIIKECDSKEMLNIMETFMIIVYKSFILEKGYNLTWGGDSNIGYRHSDKEKEKRRIRQLGKNNSAYYRQITNNVAKNPDVRKKISLAVSGKNNGMYNDHRFKGKNNPMYGKEGIYSPTSKKYKIKYPDNHIEEIIGLKYFCRKEKLPYDKIRWYCKMNKNYNGWCITKC